MTPKILHLLAGHLAAVDRTEIALNATPYDLPTTLDHTITRAVFTRMTGVSLAKHSRPTTYVQYLARLNL